MICLFLYVCHVSHINQLLFRYMYVNTLFPCENVLLHTGFNPCKNPLLTFVTFFFFVDSLFNPAFVKRKLRLWDRSVSSAVS